MRTAFGAGRVCLRQLQHCPPSRLLRSRPGANQPFSTCRSQHRPPKWWPFRNPPQRLGRKALLSSVGGGAVLGPAAFVTISEAHTDDGKTSEEHMLEISRAEIEGAVPDFVAGSKIRRGIWLFLDNWIYEPLATGFRFLKLFVIFVPVIVAAPIVFIGARDPARDNERWGAIWWYGFLVKSMERAGAAFIKLGQWAASRSDVFPKEMCSIMSSLHSNAPAHSLHVTKRIVSDAFGGKPFEEIFEEFDEKPLGVGAIAQVYKAKLNPALRMLGDSDVAEPTFGERLKTNVDVLVKSTPQRVPSSYVAIKVLHPNIERNVRRDLRIMQFFALIINAIPTMEWLSFPDEVTQFGGMMKLQLDLRIESANLLIFRKNFKDRTTAWFPYPYTQYTTRQVLIEEFAQGIPLEDFLVNGGGIYQKEIADEGLNAFLHMLLIDNFIHADLHPGNIMVRFYRPAKIEIPSYMDVISRTRSLWPQQDTAMIDGGQRQGEPQGTIASDTNATEYVLQRLRPYRHQPQEWSAELLKIDQEGYRPQLIFIDTGLVTELNDVNRQNFLDLFKAVAEFDGYKAGHLMVERCRQPSAVVDPEVFALRMQHLVLGVKSKTFALGNIKIGDVLSEVMDMIRSHHVRLEGDFVNVVLSILLLEGIGRSLDPEVDLFSGALPILRRLGTQGGGSMLRGGRVDFSMIKVWAGLEVRKLITASVEEVDRCVKYDQLSPNI